MNRLVKELKERDEEMEQFKSETTRKVNEGITSVRGCDTKSITKPTEWSGNVEEYVVWKVLVVAKMTTLDRIQPYWTILPETVQDYLLNRGLNPKVWEDLDRVEVAVEAYLKRWKLKTGAKNHDGCLNVVTR